jgi:hypothetical protein
MTVRRSRAPRHRARPRPAAAQLRVTLRETEPPVWRRVLVPYDVPLSTLHRILLTTMGWQGYHLHRFVVGDVHYGVPDKEFDDQLSYKVRPDTGATLRTVAPRAGATFTYVYDFGDSWEHDVVLERVEPLTSSHRVPYCLGGARACPPEDVGGTSGYMQMLAVLADEGRSNGKGDRWSDTANTDDAEPPEDSPASYRRWLGYDFDPGEFHPRCVNMELVRLTATDEQFWRLLPK